MKSTEFCYWLQGYFEIAGPEATLDRPGSLDLMTRHLELVRHHQGSGASSESARFCLWFEGFIEASRDLTPDGFGLSATRIIRSKLSDAFLLEIDPSYGDADTDAQRSSIHREPKTKPTFVAMC